MAGMGNGKGKKGNGFRAGAQLSAPDRNLLDKQEHGELLYGQNMIGYWMQKYRRGRGMTQSELGRLVGKTGSAIHRYEVADVDPPAMILHRVARILGKPVGKFFQNPETDPDTKNQEQRR